MASSEEDPINTEPDLEDDLFGDEDNEDEPAVEKPRELSDEELGSGDDEGRDDRAKDEGVYKAQDDQEQLRIEEKTLWRHPLPKPLDGEVNTPFQSFQNHTDSSSSIPYAYLNSLE
jgi:RNA polymerase-associated protein LEO1